MVGYGATFTITYVLERYQIYDSDSTVYINATTWPPYKTFNFRLFGDNW
jgi:hypothetical protein